MVNPATLFISISNFRLKKFEIELIMAYTVLARRYRSQTFDDVVWQDAAGQTLKSASESGRVAHAYLFTGTRGSAKRQWPGSQPSR